MTGFLCPRTVSQSCPEVSPRTQIESRQSTGFRKGTSRPKHRRIGKDVMRHGRLAGDRFSFQIGKISDIRWEFRYRTADFWPTESHARPDQRFRPQPRSISYWQRINSSPEYALGILTRSPTGPPADYESSALPTAHQGVWQSVVGRGRGLFPHQCGRPAIRIINQL